MGEDQMDVRDQFAAAALSGLCANTEGWSMPSSKLADAAYAVVEAMMAERAKRNKRASVSNPYCDQVRVARSLGKGFYKVACSLPPGHGGECQYERGIGLVEEMESNG